MSYTTARANFRTFSQTDQNFRTTLKFQEFQDNFAFQISTAELQRGMLHHNTAQQSSICWCLRHIRTARDQGRALGSEWYE